MDIYKNALCECGKCHQIYLMVDRHLHKCPLTKEEIRFNTLNDKLDLILKKLDK